MNKRFLIAWAVLFVAWFAGSFVVHGMLLGDDYKALQGTLFRTEADSQKYFPWMILAHVLMSGAFVWIYAKGVESRDWFPQGLRYGVAIALLGIVPTYLIYFAVQPTPQALIDQADRVRRRADAGARCHRRVHVPRRRASRRVIPPKRAARASPRGPATSGRPFGRRAASVPLVARRAAARARP